MVSIFSKNGILAGRIDHCCLICAERLTNEEETLAHIGGSQHRENLKTFGYVEKYKKDYIRKAKGIYFCELCNLTFTTTKNVELHIDEQPHKQKKETYLCLIRVENDIIAFNQFIISDDAWNGCVEDTCFLCDTEFDDSSSHKVIISHVLNLMNSKVIFEENNKRVYRMIGNRFMQCLTCNVIIVRHHFNNHWESADHKLAYKHYDPTVQKNEAKNTIPTIKNTN